uniref:Integrin, alpha 1 n=1 Tax=Oryzias sinensis TaxID=183150 RepID=A0A8C7YFQ1_9TELE
MIDLSSSFALAVLLACVSSFNVDQKNGLSFSGPLEDLFGYTVQQFENSEGKWVLIGSPLSGQPATRTGDVYKCPVGREGNKCVKLDLPKNTTIPKLREVKENMTMGTTLVTNPRGGFLACGPQYGYMCGQQQYISGVCANVSSSFQILNSVAPAVQECARNLDIVIVLDGSNSIYPWTSIVDFLVSFIQNTTIGPHFSQVGIVSYGENVSHLVNLSQFDNTGKMVEFVSHLPQHTGTKTNTFLAIETARKEAFLPERGARPEAKKVMVIVTDGESHDFHKLDSVIAKCEKDGIERFGIAVLGDYNRQNKNHFFNVSDEVALLSIVDTLGSKIFALEATTGNFTSSFEMEMSQTGFSVHPIKDGMLMGAVGAYDWNGTVVMQTAKESLIPGKTQFYDPKSEAGYEGLAGYLGYDVKSATTRDGELYITGAPRFNHTGRVVIYSLNGSDLVISQTLKGEQIGSYFGSVLQTIDIDKDGYTDLLLVGAPMFMGPERDEQGQVYVYKLNQGLFEHEFTLKPKNQSCCPEGSSDCNEPCGARFGTAIAAVLDLNLDGFNDVAIGAPLENNHMGAAYIYHGDKTSLKEKFVQHIPAGGSGTKFFGQSIHGVMDLNGDGITDVTIGGLGGASLFWSRDVAELHANMSFNPGKINLQQPQNKCEHRGRESVCVVTTVCFYYRVKSDNQNLESNASELIRTIFYPGFFTLSFLFLFFQSRITVWPAVIDLLQCKSFGTRLHPPGETCTTQPHLTALLTSPSMVVKGRAKMDVQVTVKDKGDNAYNTKVLVTFTPNINYVKVEVSCLCSLFLVVFVLLFLLNKFYIFLYILLHFYLSHSDSEERPETLIDNSVYISIPVRYEAGITFEQCEQSSCASFSCSIGDVKRSQVNVTFRVWKPTFIKVRLHAPVHF